MKPIAGILCLAALLSDPQESTVLREGIQLRPGQAFILEGWVQASGGDAWLAVEVAEPGGKVVGREETPPVPVGVGWTYTAAETAPAAGDPARTAPLSARIYLVARGKAEARDVRLAPHPPEVAANGGFEAPLDGKGRIPFWSEEKDAQAVQGKREGTHWLDSTAGREGKAGLALSASGEVYAVSSVSYPVPPWSDRFEVMAAARSEPGARARVLAVWADDGAKRVLRVDAGAESAGAEWRTVTTGPLEPPPGARAVRAVLCAVRPDSAGPPAVARFDDAAIVTLPPRTRRVVVAVNQVGYERSGPKSAVVLTNFFPRRSVSGQLEVVDGDGRAALKVPLPPAGRIRGEKGADWGWFFWRGDFSGLERDGRYTARASIDGAEGTSFPFAIARDLLFRETAPLVVDFFFVQRCGFEVPGWHAACHLDDARLPGGAHRDLAGGWHSAGDYNKITWEYGDGGAVYALAGAAAAAPDLFAGLDRNGDGLPDALDEAWWGARYLAKLQTGEGGFLKDIQQGPDRQSWMRWVPPEKQTDNAPGTADDPIVLEGEGHSPLAIGGWARLEKLLRARGVETDFAARAMKCWEHESAGASARPDPLLLLGALELVGALDLLGASDGESQRAFALRSAAAMLETPGSDPASLPDRLRGGYGDSGDIPAAALATLALRFPEEDVSKRIRRVLASHLDRVLAEAANPFGISKQKAGGAAEEGYFFEPSSAYGQNFLFACRAWSALCIYRLLGDRRALRYATDHLDFILGKNPYGLCMLEGKGGLNPPRYHHRYDSIPGRERGAVPGAIPNGFVRDSGSQDRPGFDISAGGREHPSYRTNEPWLVHDVFFLLAVTAHHEALR